MQAKRALSQNGTRRPGRAVAVLPVAGEASLWLMSAPHYPSASRADDDWLYGSAIVYAR